MELTTKNKKLESLYKVCLREFPEYRQEIPQIFDKKDFIQMVREYSQCEKKLKELNDINKIREGYEKLLKEIKEEINHYILKNIRGKNKNEITDL
jgi:hypothetical protein